MKNSSSSLKKLASFFLVFSTSIIAAQGQGISFAAQGSQASFETFTNPLLPSGADPWSIFHGGFYYYMHTTGINLTIWKARSLADLKRAEKKIVWTPPRTGPYSKDIWAPELHYLQGKWYIYFAADAGSNESHRLWVLENGSPDPLQGEWVMKGKLADVSDKWAIDGSVFEHMGNLYAVWSGWEGDVNGRQDIYLARMKNPWTIDGERVRLSMPEYPWEKVGDIKDNPREPPHVDVNEGPQILKHGDKLFLVYSASGCWTENYALGMLTASASSNLLNSASWKKSEQPVFQQSREARAYGTGHNSFFRSPDGTEDWILYHANAKPGQGCGRFRSPRAQRFTWNADGTPNFGRPVPIGKRIRKPSGERKSTLNRTRSIPGPDSSRILTRTFYRRG
jgi:GH43 family beta-xylosidase